MFTVDFFNEPGTVTVASREIDCQTIGEAVEQAKALLRNPAAALGSGLEIKGYVITDALNAVLHSSFDDARQSFK